MALIVVAASTRSQDFAVIDFTKAPPKTTMVSASASGNVIDCYAKLAAVGDWGSGKVTLFDLSDPEKPVQRGSVSTNLTSVTAISIDGAHVLAAGPNNTNKKLSVAELVFISIANPNQPQVVSSYGHTGITGSESISNVIIRGGNALSCQTDGCLVMNCANASNPTGGAYPGPTIGLNGQVLGDFDGKNGVITAPPPDWDGYEPVFLYQFSIANGIGTPPVKTQVGGLLSAVAIAEIPNGGHYLATATTQSVGIQAFPENLPTATTGFFLPDSGAANAAVALKFLNNPAIAPLLAVANVTNQHGFLITSNFLVLESNGQTSTIQIATPNPVATVALAPTANPTLGITGW